MFDLFVGLASLALVAVMYIGAFAVFLKVCFVILNWVFGE